MALALGLAAGRDRARPLRVPGAPGRLERIAARGVTVFVDYAHTDDALAHALAALRALSPRRLLCVFGCGGDRDRGKRPLMGLAAGRGADLVVVTSDNPRTEDPGAIIAEIVPGLVGGRGPAASIARPRAAASAATWSRPTGAPPSGSPSRRLARATPS